MTDETNIQPIQSDFEQIRKTAESGQEYWSARELASALGYSTWQKFNRVLNKALQVAQNRGMGETPEEALKREIREELSAEISVEEFLCTVKYGCQGTGE